MKIVFALVSLIALSELACIKSSSSTKAIGSGGAKTEEALIAGEQHLVPLIFQEKFGTNSGSLVSCFYEETRQLTVDDSGAFKFADLQGEATRLTERAIVWSSLVFSSVGAANASWQATMSDETKRKDALKTIGGYALIFLAKKLMPSGDQEASDLPVTSESNLGDVNAKSSQPSESLPDLLFNGGLRDLKDAALSKLKDAVAISKSLARMVAAVQGDGLQEGEVKELVDPMSYAAFKALVMQAGKDSKYESCRNRITQVP